MSMSSPRKSIDSLESPLSPLPQRSAYPFPQLQNASSLQSASANRYRSRQGSTASTLSINSVANSVGGSLDINAPRGNVPVIEAGQNAISSLLQPPILRTGLSIPTASASSSTYKAPTTRDIPPVTLTNIPKVDPTAFKDYLSRIGPLFETFQRNRAENLANSIRAASDKASKDSDLPPNSPILFRQLSTTSLLSPTDAPQPRRRSSAYARRKLNEPTPLNTIPNVYFEDNFQLENPRIFDVVSEHAEIVKPPPGSNNDDSNGATRPPRKSLATNAILQEKMSWYMDTVEVHLINSISNASTSFFAALGSLRDLEHEAAESVTRIQKLRGDLARLDQDMAIGGLEVANLRKRHENLGKLGRAVEQVARVVDDARECEFLVEKGEFDAASDAMARLGMLIAGQSEDDDSTGASAKLVDLRSLRALQGMSENMNYLQLRISKGFEMRFLNALLSDLRRHVEQVPPNDTLRRWASTFQRQRGEARSQAAPPAYMDSTALLRDHLLASLNGLTGPGQTARATASFRETVMREMKAIIRKHLPSSNEDDTRSITSVSTRSGSQASQSEKSTILARNLRALDEDAAEELFTNIYTNVSEALRRLSVQTKVLLDVTSTVNVPPQSPVSIKVQSPDGQRSRSRSPIPGPRSPGPRSMQDDLSQALDLSSLLGQAVDIAQDQITRILKVRTEQSVRMPLNRFLRYFILNRLFADECEAVSGRSGTALKNIVSGQLTAFVHSRSEAESLRIAKTLDSDQWEAKDFTENHQAILSRILQAMSSDPPEWVQGTRIWDESSPAKANGAPVTNGNAATNGEVAADSAAPGKPQTRPAYIDESRYILVASAMSLLEPVDEFLSLIASIPSISSIAIQALAELLRTFNSRTSQLVLGAGATRIAGLKNITTKHLALASQALSFVIALIPYMREAARRHVGAGANKAELLGEFDKIKRLYQDHQMGIHDKLVEIMTGRATAHVNAMKKIDFDAEADEGPSSYMDILTKETGTLYRVLNRHLSEPDVTGVLVQIFNSYQDTWTRAFADVDIKTVGGKARLTKDAELFDARLGKIEGFGDIGRKVIESVKAKTVAESSGESALAATDAGGPKKDTPAN